MLKRGRISPLPLVTLLSSQTAHLTSLSYTGGGWKGIGAPSSMSGLSRTGWSLLSKDLARTQQVINEFCSIRVHQLLCSFIGIEQREMEVEEGSARASWYERVFLIDWSKSFLDTQVSLAPTHVRPG